MTNRKTDDSPFWLQATAWTALAALVLGVVLYGLSLAFPRAPDQPADLRRLLQYNAILASLGLHGADTPSEALERDPGKLAAIRQAIDRLEREARGTAEVAYLRGLERFAAGDGAGARVALEEARLRNPDSLQTELALGTVHFANRDLDWAEEAFRRVLALDPQNRAGMSNLGQTLYILGKREEAEALYRRVSELEAAGARPELNLTPAPR